jgi:ankyrin repeat protein
MEWIYKQEPYISFSRPGGGVRVLNLYTNGNSLIDISEVSRLFYFDFDSDNTHPYETVLNSPRMTAYFEFDQHDSRYNTISSLLIYLLNIFVWRFWPGSEELISTELRFLSHTNAWSHEDLFHLYSTLRNGGRGSKLLTIFVSCFDQCPKDQRDWFLERIVKEQSYSDTTYRLIVSSSAKDDLVEGSFPNETCINLDDSPTLRGIGDNMAKEIESSLSSLMVKRPVYEGLRPYIKNVLEPLRNLPFLSRIILTWLETHLHGKPRDRIADVVRKLTPATTENIVKVFIASLDPMLRSRAETVFNWIKYAAEPWSPEALTEALAVHDSGSKEPSLHDLDVERTVAEIEEAFGGIIIVKDRSVKFSHASFYLVPALGFEGSDVEKTERANSTIANTCLRYFHLSGAQENFSKLFRNNSNADGAPWVTELDTAIISHDRTSMAEYAVRFWHHHYQVSGQFKPKDLVYKLFASTDARASWAVPFWLLSNPFTRIQRSYVSTLPTFAMLGLEDLVQEAIQHERNQPKFEKDCWFAIVEAARAGRKAMVQSLLKEVTVDEDELQIALHWAVACQDAGIVDILLDKIPNPETFHWPDNILHRASAAGLNDVIAFLLSAGFDVDEPCGLYWGAPPAVIIAWRNRVSTMEFLLSSGYEPNLAIKDTGGDDPLMTAADKGIPRMVDMLVQNGASVETTNDNGNRPVLRAARECNYKAVDLLIQAKADFVSGSEDGLKSPLITAAASGSLECVRVLLANGADPDVEIDGMTALYEAVASNYPDIVALLLTHDPRPNMEKTPPGQLRLLMRAVGTKNAELVSLLLEHGTTVDFFDPNAATLTKTPLSEACSQGNLEIVKLLLAKGADINYAEGNSDSPLLAATMGSSEVARYLLLNPTIDVRWAASDGTTALHTADYDPSLVAELLQRGAHIDAHSTSFGTAIHKATRSNSANIIEVLLANDPKPDVDFLYGEDGWQYEEIGFTALQLACKYGFPECAKALLKGGANPRFINKNGDDAVDVVLQAQSESKDALECLQLLLSVPYSVPADQVSEHGRTRLHGIQEKTPVTVVQNLLEVNAPLDVENREGHSPLSIAVSKGNEDVVRYLVKQGATVNRCKPSFGSILHLAVKRGDLQIAKFLIESGAELDTVDPEYGESLLYTALGIEDYAKLKAMVRYLVDDVKAPINKLGGVHFSYPIIRAANLARANHAWVPVLRFLISRNAQLDVADSQGRRAVHVASASWWDDAIKLLVKAGANMDVVDAIGRKPIHFAASSLWSDCFEYLVNTYPDMDMNEADYDKWTPLMWAARSGTADTMIRLLQGNVDVWARSCDSNMKIEWSALKLLNFSGHNDPEESLQLDFKERTQPRPEQEMEEWDDPFHKIETGHLKNYRCNSCFLVSHTLPTF